MSNGNNSDPLHSGIFSKESLTLIKAMQAWQLQQWRALTTCPFPVMFYPDPQPPLPQPEKTQPKRVDEEAPPQD